MDEKVILGFNDRDGINAKSVMSTKSYPVCDGKKKLNDLGPVAVRKKPWY